MKRFVYARGANKQPCLLSSTDGKGGRKCIADCIPQVDFVDVHASLQCAIRCINPPPLPPPLSPLPDLIPLHSSSSDAVLTSVRAGGVGKETCKERKNCMNDADKKKVSMIARMNAGIFGLNYWKSGNARFYRALLGGLDCCCNLLFNKLLLRRYSTNVCHLKNSLRSRSEIILLKLKLVVFTWIQVSNAPCNHI